MESDPAGNPIIDAEGSRRRLARFSTVGFALLLVSLVVALVPGISRGTGTDLKAGKVFQQGRSLVIEMTIGPELVIESLQRNPDVSKPRSTYLCAEFRRSATSATKRVCIGGGNDRYRKVGFTLVSPAGETIRQERVDARVERLTDHKARVSLIPGKVGMTPERWRWRLVYSNGECLTDPTGCQSRLPDSAWFIYRLRPVDPVGCTGGNGQVVRSGPGGKKLIALTFDDGPSPYTPQVLSILRKRKVKATFFVVGSMVRSDPSTARKIVAQGHEIANHSYSHPVLPGRGELDSTNRVIRSTTRFRPCLFRPPYGAIDSRLVADVRAAKMKSVLWNVDTVDWTQPGSGSIYSSIVSAGPGSIVLMHDGGGPRGGTVAALSPAISNLKARGYRFVTVSRLLGNRVIYRPR